VTLIAAFRCDNAAVICADSQETVGDYRVTVDKIKPQDAGRYELVIGGAGASGPLLDRFMLDVVHAVQNWPENLASDKIESRLVDLFRTFHLAYISISTYQSEDFAFIVCIRSKTSHQISLWQLRDIAVLPITSYSLIGWDESLYHHEVQWLFQSRSWINHAVMMGIRLFVMAEATSNYIKGPLQLIVVDEDKGMRVYDQADVKELQRRVEPFNKVLRDVVLNASDMSIPEGELMAVLRVFEDRILDLRAHFTGRSRFMGIIENLPKP